MKQTAFTLILMLALLTAAAATIDFTSPASANPTNFQLSMPIEHINYTITEVNGTLWAKIDGNYPLQIQKNQTCWFSDALPMVYPMPPNSTNIHLTLNGTELEWSNYTKTFPESLHRTAIGDWWMTYSVLENVSDSFLLQIHYEHPLERVNGSYILLYDLNIIDYLSTATPDSTAYFTFQFDSNVSNLQVYTAPVDSEASMWQPKDSSISSEGSFSVVSVEVHSVYAALLPGDLVVVFSDQKQAAQSSGEESVWVVPVLIDVVLVLVIVYVKRKAIASAFSSRKTTN